MRAVVSVWKNGSSMPTTFCTPLAAGCVPSDWKSLHTHTRPSLRPVTASHNAAEPVQDRCLQQEMTYQVALAIQHLLGQIVQDVAVAATESRHEGGDVALAL